VDLAADVQDHPKVLAQSLAPTTPDQNVITAAVVTNKKKDFEIRAVILFSFNTFTVSS
jgi:hypothetical protein